MFASLYNLSILISSADPIAPVSVTLWVAVGFGWFVCLLIVCHVCMYVTMYVWMDGM